VFVQALLDVTRRLFRVLAVDHFSFKFCATGATSTQFELKMIGREKPQIMELMKEILKVSLKHLKGLLR
jgi:hypothetical protein